MRSPPDSAGTIGQCGTLLLLSLSSCAYLLRCKRIADTSVHPEHPGRCVTTCAGNRRRMMSRLSPLELGSNGDNGIRSFTSRDVSRLAHRAIPRFCNRENDKFTSSCTAKTLAATSNPLYQRSWVARYSPAILLRIRTQT